MSVDVTVEQAIARDRDTVARFVMDPANDTRWIKALTSVRTLNGDVPVGVGTQVERVASFLGRRIEYVNEIVALEPGRRLAMRSVKAPFPMEVTYELGDAGEGTLMRIRAAGDAGGFYRIAGPLLGQAVRRGIARDLAELKRVMEDGR
jgi:carbon monoxide dehydrogenase subunit G